MMKTPVHDFEPGHLPFCQVCNSKQLELVLDLGHQAPCDSLLTAAQMNEPETTYPLRMVRCRDCGLVQIDYVVDGSKVYHRDYPYRSGITKELADHHHRLSIDLVKRCNIPSDSLVIDIGSNDGTLLKGFKRQGMRVLGIEPTNVAKFAVEDGIDTIQSFFTDKLADEILRQHGKAKLITATNMFAHMATLGSVIRGVERLLDDDGVFVIENHYLLNIIEQLQYDSIYHEHLRSYAMKPLLQLFSYYDLSVVDAYRVASYGGSIRVFVAKGRNRPASAGLSNLIAEEHQAGLYDSAIYDQFRAKVLKTKRDLYNLAVDAEAKQQRFVGNSCPGRCATLLNYVGIDRELMPYIAEQPTSLKLGLHLPGKHIPVVENSILFKEQPDYTVLLAWHYWQPISADLRKRGLKSKFVLPLPELRILSE
jgi:SAM-dependent methyltransferase